MALRVNHGAGEGPPKQGQAGGPDVSGSTTPGSDFPQLHIAPDFPCCEDCKHFRHHPQTGSYLCMTVMSDDTERRIRDGALRAINARTRCRHFTPAKAPPKVRCCAACRHLDHWPNSTRPRCINWRAQPVCHHDWLDAPTEANPCGFFEAARIHP